MRNALDGVSPQAKSTYRGRLAPTPTGYLHRSHARTFWRAQERAQAAGGVLVLRNEDWGPGTLPGSICGGDDRGAALVRTAVAGRTGLRRTVCALRAEPAVALYRGALLQLQAGGYV